MKFKIKTLTEDRKYLANTIRKGSLKHGNSLVDDNASEKAIADADAYDPRFSYEYAESGDTKIQLQDRSRNLHYLINGRNFEASPRVSSHTWGRIWKNGELEKQFEGPKYVVRQDMAKYLDDTNDGMREDWRNGIFDEKDLQAYGKKMKDEAGRIAYSINSMINKHPECKDDLLDIAYECAYILKVR